MIKKLSSLVLAMVMLIALGVPAAAAADTESAQEEAYTITLSSDSLILRGENKSLTATVYDASNQVVPGAVVEFSNSEPNVYGMTVKGNTAQLSPSSTGFGYVTARYRNAEAMCLVTVSGNWWQNSTAVLSSETTQSLFYRENAVFSFYYKAMNTCETGLTITNEAGEVVYYTTKGYVSGSKGKSVSAFGTGALDYDRQDGNGYQAFRADFTMNTVLAGLTAGTYTADFQVFSTSSTTTVVPVVGPDGVVHWTSSGTTTSTTVDAQATMSFTVTPYLIVETAGASEAWDGSIADSYSGGSGTEDDPYQISSGRELARMASQVNHGNEFQAHYRLTRDIDLNHAEWTPIGSKGTPFTGVFDGRGFSITGCRITQTYMAAGLFGWASDGSKISNLTLTDVQISTGTTTEDAYYAGLVGYLGGTVSDCNVYGSVLISDITAEESFVGAIAGFTELKAEIKNCRSEASVGTNSSRGSLNIGNLVGCNMGTVSACFSTGSTNAEQVYRGANAYVGGAIGYNMGLAVMCASSDNTVSASGRGELWCGGFMGSDSTLLSLTSKCFSKSTVVVENENYIDNILSYAGGFAGQAIGAIKDCYAASAISGTMETANGAPCVGGFAGLAGGSIYNCFCRSYNVRVSNKSGIVFIGGFAGMATDGKIQNCFATLQRTGYPELYAYGKESNSTYIKSGYFIGDLSDTQLVRCYYLNTMSVKSLSTGLALSAYVGPCSKGYTDNFKDPDWIRRSLEFKDDVWNAGNSAYNESFPYLRWEESVGSESGLVLKKLPEKYVYRYGDVLDLTGMELQTGTGEVISSGYLVDLKIAYNQPIYRADVVITYGTNEVQFPVYVLAEGEKRLLNISDHTVDIAYNAAEDLIVFAALYDENGKLRSVSQSEAKEGPNTLHFTFQTEVSNETKERIALFELNPNYYQPQTAKQMLSDYPTV